MYWFKHKVRPNQVLIKAMDEYKHVAYVLYNMACEAYANEFDQVINKLLVTCGQPVDNLCISCVYVELSLVTFQNQTRTKRKAIENVFGLFKKKGFLYYKIKSNLLYIYVPEVFANTDEYTKKNFNKLGINYPDIVKRLSGKNPVPELELE